MGLLILWYMGHSKNETPYVPLALSLTSVSWRKGNPHECGSVWLYFIILNYFVILLYLNCLNSLLAAVSQYSTSTEVLFQCQGSDWPRPKGNCNFFDLKYRKKYHTQNECPQIIFHRWKRRAEKYHWEIMSFLSLSEWCNKTSANWQDRGT